MIFRLSEKDLGSHLGPIQDACQDPFSLTFLHDETPLQCMYSYHHYNVATVEDIDSPEHDAEYVRLASSKPLMRGWCGHGWDDFKVDN